MIKKETYNRVLDYVITSLKDAHIEITDFEKESIEVADMGLGRIDEFGLEVITYINTNRCCSKELVLLPYQICPEHRHPAIGTELGKEETFRCRKGEVYLYTSGIPTKIIKGKIPEDKKEYFTVFQEVVLLPGQQYTIEPNTLHWFQAGPEGCVVSEFSTSSRDELDIFTDPQIKRAPELSQ